MWGPAVQAVSHWVLTDLWGPYVIFEFRASLVHMHYVVSDDSSKCQDWSKRRTKLLNQGNLPAALWPIVWLSGEHDASPGLGH